MGHLVRVKQKASDVDTTVILEVAACYAGHVSCLLEETSVSRETDERSLCITIHRFVVICLHDEL